MVEERDKRGREKIHKAATELAPGEIMMEGRIVIFFAFTKIAVHESSFGEGRDEQR